MKTNFGDVSCLEKVLSIISSKGIKVGDVGDKSIGRDIIKLADIAQQLLAKIRLQQQRSDYEKRLLVLEGNMKIMFKKVNQNSDQIWKKSNFDKSNQIGKKSNFDEIT